MGRRVGDAVLLDVACVPDGVRSGHICNTRPSQVTEDDGGYVRMMGQAYYQQPVPLASIAVGAGAAVGGDG